MKLERLVAHVKPVLHAINKGKSNVLLVFAAAAFAGSITPSASASASSSKTTAEATVMGVFPDGFSVLSEALSEAPPSNIAAFSCNSNSGSCYLLIPDGDKVTPPGRYYAHGEQQGTLSEYFAPGANNPLKNDSPDFPRLSRAYNARITDMFNSARIQEISPRLFRRSVFNSEQGMPEAEYFKFLLGGSWEADFKFNHTEFGARNCTLWTPIQKYESEDCSFEGAITLKAAHEYLRLLGIDKNDILGSVRSLAEIRDSKILQPMDYQDLFPEFPATDNAIRPIVFFPKDMAVDDKLIAFYTSKMIEVQHFYAANTGGRTFKIVPPIIVTGDNDAAWYRCEPGQADCLAVRVNEAYDPEKSFAKNLFEELKHKQIMHPISKVQNRMYTIFAIGGGTQAFVNEINPNAEYIYALIGDESFRQVRIFPRNQDYAYLDFAGIQGHEIGHISGLRHINFLGYRRSGLVWNQTIMGEAYQYPDVGFLPEELSILSRSRFLYPLGDQEQGRNPERVESLEKILKNYPDLDTPVFRRTYLEQFEK